MRIELTVPSTLAGQTVTDDTLADRTFATEGFLCALFGGCTTTDGVGSWVSDGEVVRERVRICTSYTDGDTLDADYIRALEVWCSAVARSWEQDCILFTIGDTPHFIGQEA